MAAYLKAHKVIETLDVLDKRISERFGGSGLSRVCGALLETARLTAPRARAAGRPNLLLWFITLLFIGSLGYAAWAAEQYLHLGDLFMSWRRGTQPADHAELAQGLESVVNLLILAGASIWFLLTVESRVRRRFILRHLHELRSFAHVVDMHQLTKDPAAILGKVEPTKSSPKREMSEQELARYLDYCTEMLSIIGKLAALYEEHSDDTQIIAAANDIEALTTNLDRKIWQKITLISRNNLVDSGVQPGM